MFFYLWFVVCFCFKIRQFEREKRYRCSFSDLQSLLFFPYYSCFDTSLIFLQLAKMNLLHKRDFVASPYKSERDKLIYVKRMDVRRFFKLLDKLDDFLEHDKCCRLADNYLIAMVFTYFLRASYEPQEYTRQNFFAALFLAYNMEEDEGEFLVVELEDFLDCNLADLKHLRYELFQRIDYRAAVSRSCCEVVMRYANPEHKIWQRRRHVYHSGIVSKNTWCAEGIQNVCPVCEGESESESEEDVDY